ncbi:MAG: hypothetical protein IJA39_01680 [Clostridia bacterium]|nr:hypothetical protein [Clostridia bacterium]
MSDYIDRVRKRIHNKRLKEEISSELSTHIDEKIKDYTDMGCSPEEAARRAEADMGDEPERVAGLLESIHAYSRWGRILGDVIAGLIMLAAVIAEICYFIIFLLGPNELNGTVFCGCCYSLYIILLLISLKKKYCVFPFMVSLFTLTALPFSWNINFVTTFFEAVTGGLPGYYSDVVNKEVYPGILSIVLFAVYMTVVLSSGISVSVFSFSYMRNRLTAKGLRAKRTVKRILTVLLIATVISTSLMIPVFFTEPDYKYEFFEGLALIPIESEDEAREIIERHVNDYRHKEITEEECYYIDTRYTLFDTIPECFGYVNGEMIYYSPWDLRTRNREHIDLFTDAVIYKSTLDIETENGYLLCIPLIGYLIEEQPSEDIDKYYSAEDAFMIPLPLEKPEYITLNIVDSRYELKLY